MGPDIVLGEPQVTSAGVRRCGVAQHSKRWPHWWLKDSED